VGLERGLGGGFGFVGGDGFDEASDGEGIADTALSGDEMERAVEAGEGDGNFDKDGDAGAVDLRDVGEIDDELAGALIHELLDEVVEMLAGLTDGEASMHFDEVDASGFADGDFQGWVQGHQRFPSTCQFAGAPQDIPAGAATALYD